MNNLIQVNPIIRIINEKADLRRNDSKTGVNIYSLYLMKKINYKMLNKRKLMVPYL